MTKEEILIKNEILDPKKWDGIMLDNFPLMLTRDTHVYTMRMIFLSMEEYGKLMYNQAIEDAANNADADYTIIDTGIGPYTESYVIKDSILKLKKI